MNLDQQRPNGGHTRKGKALGQNPNMKGPKRQVLKTNRLNPKSAGFLFLSFFSRFCRKEHKRASAEFVSRPCLLLLRNSLSLWLAKHYIKIISLQPRCDSLQRQRRSPQRCRASERVFFVFCFFLKYHHLVSNNSRKSSKIWRAGKQQTSDLEEESTEPLCAAGPLAILFQNEFYHQNPIGLFFYLPPLYLYISLFSVASHSHSDTDR